MAEEFALDQFARDGGAVHLNKRHRAAAALLVDIPRHEFLSGSVRTGDEHSGRSRCDLGDNLAYMVHRSRVAYHIRAVNLLLEGLVLLGEGDLVGRILDCNQDAVEVKRLLDKVEGALLDAVHGGVDITVAGNHHNGRVDAHLHTLVEDLDTVHLRHLDVAEDYVILLLAHKIEGHKAVFSLVNLIALIREYFGKGIADCAFVVNYKYLHKRQPISAPFTRASCGVMKRILPSFCLAISIIPRLSMPLMMRGLRLARMQICLPTISSGL